MYATRILREAAAVAAAADDADDFAALLVEALEDPEVRAAVQDATRQPQRPQPRARTGGGRRG